MVLRWGILGAAKFARLHMGPAIHAARGNALVALASTSSGKAADFQAFAPGLRLHDSYEALLADPGVDAVYIPLPNHLHVEWSLRAVAAGKHVLCEKPMGLQAADFDPLIAAREASGLMVAEALMIAHHPQWAQVAALIAGGAIGRVEHADAFFSYDNSGDPGNIRQQAGMGGGGLRDIGVYTIGALRLVTGAEPDSLRAVWRCENDVDVFAQVSGGMAGAQGRFSFTSTTSMRLFPRQEVVFQGREGLIRVSAPFNAGLFGEAQVELHQPGRSEVFRYPGFNQYVAQVEAFARSAREGADYACPLEFSRGTQAVLDRIFAVATEG